MPFNVLLLPLLGGYILISRWNRTRFSAARYSGERLIFHAAIAGAILLGLAMCIRFLCFALAEPQLRAAIPEVGIDYFWTSVLSFGLGIALIYPLNRIYKKDAMTRRVIAESCDFLEMLLERAMQEVRQVSISCQSGKFYIGYVTSNFDPSYDRRYLKILPTVSGYRDPATRRFVWTTNYTAVLERVMDEPAQFGSLDSDHFEIVLPISEVQAVNIWDPDAYELFVETASLLQEPSTMDRGVERPSNPSRQTGAGGS